VAIQAALAFIYIFFLYPTNVLYSTMYTRRFYRIKVFQQLYAYFQELNPNLPLHEKNMMKSLEKTHELYVYILSYLPEFHHFVEVELDTQRNKFIPNNKSIEQLQALQQNKLLLNLSQSESLKGLIKHYKLIWNDTKELNKQIWNLTKSFNPFLAYVANSTRDFGDDRRFILEWIQLILIDSDLMDSTLEDKYINWEDDQTLVLSNLLKSIDKMKEISVGKGIELMRIDNEAKIFMIDLLNKCVTKNEEYSQMLAAKIQNWDVERIALVDMLLMKMALCEILSFENIPVKVSINEYLELAKLYSTPQSHGFINGILDKLQLDLRKNNGIHKTGRGLVE
jgi:N utilization substance protein B